MKTVTFDSPTQGTISYTDKKRGLWWMSALYPLFPITGLVLHALTGIELMLLVPMVTAYICVPLFDYLLGEDLSNPPEEVVAQLEQDRYYSRLLYLAVPLHFITFFAAVYWIVTQDLSMAGYLILAVGAGMTSGLGINTGHELGHKTDPLSRLMAKIVLAVPGYGHFCLEHNAGHHRHVATPEDTASSKMGENIYAFALREIPGGFKRAWQLEKVRLQRKGKSMWSPSNELLQSYAITAIIQISLLIAFGWMLLPFLIIHNFLAWWQLTSANYIEHYGLLRGKKANGSYERCQPHHSWNSNHVFSNLLLYHLERHSDHHAHPTRHYQSLRNFDDVPALPNGYFGAYLMAYCPPIWFAVMDPRLLNLQHIQGDLSKVNILPGKREAIEQKYAALVAA
jgi:alkane 1-monooxygenase